MKKKHIAFLTIILLLVLLKIYIFGDILSFDYIKTHQLEMITLYQKMPLAFISLYFLFYIFVTTLSLPGATLITLFGGATFGFWTSLPVISFASTIGASFAFLISRKLLREIIEKKYRKHFEKINEGVEKEGGSYLFSIRLLPVFPFFLINILMGLTKMPVKKYFIISQLGMLPATIVYINAGVQLAKINSVEDILSPALVLSFAILGTFPLMAKKIVEYLRKKSA